MEHRLIFPVVFLFAGACSSGAIDGALGAAAVDQETGTEDGSSSNTQPDAPADPATPDDPPESEDPILPSLIVARRAFETNLDWAPANVESAQFQDSAQRLLEACETYPERLDRLEILDAFQVEGLSRSDPIRQPSESLRTELDQTLVAAGYCVYFAEPVIANLNQASLERLLERVFSTYVGGADSDSDSDNDDPGNPINEQYVLPVVFLLDFLFDDLSPTMQERAASFASDLETRVRGFMEGLGPNDKRRINNWAMTALSIRYFATVILDEVAQASVIAQELEHLISESLTPPGDFELSSCDNLASVGVYGSFDLQERDAFRYHTTVFQKAFTLMVLGHEFSEPTEQLLRDGFAILEPYVSGDRVHHEFVCSTVELDRIRAEAGDPGFSGRYDPLSQKYVYRWGRVALPSTQAWTEQFLTESYRLWDLMVLTGKE